MENYGEMFSEEQMQAVIHKDGPMLVLAGPGSGKTFTIVGRVQYMIEEHGICPEYILVATFTRAAAGEMQKRFEKQTGGRYYGVTFGTIHAVLLSILYHELGVKTDSILTYKEKRRILRWVLDQSHMPSLAEEPGLADRILADIEKNKVRVDREEMEVTGYCTPEVFVQMCRMYREECRRRGKLDFEDILLLCSELLEHNMSVLARWQRVYRYILVDEAQDCSLVQYRIMKLLAGENGNLMFVGDDDQSLYGFRGANPWWMVRYTEEFPAGTQVHLSVNFRSSPAIVEAADRLIAHNQNRCEKRQRAAADIRNEKPNCEQTAELEAGSATQEALRVSDYPTVNVQYEAIAEELAQEIQTGNEPGEYAILLRTNGQIPSLAAHLARQNVPFRICEAVANPYRHWAAEDMVLYIRMVLRNADREEIFRVLSRPYRGFARELYGKLGEGERVDVAAAAGRLARAGTLSSRNLMELNRFCKDISLLAKLRPVAAIRYIRKGMRYDSDYITKVCGKRSEEEEKRVYGILDELESQAEGCLSLQLWLEEMERLSKEWEKQKHPRTGGVSIMTYHGAKGLEFPCVYLPDVNEENTPHHKAVTEGEIEEERRMFYVAVTRAKERIRLSYVADRQKKPSVSRFLGELLGETGG